MHFTEATVGDYRIYAGALEASGGYVAAVVVSRMRGAGQDEPGPKEAFRDTAMSGGHRWAKPDEALMYAVTTARAMILTEAHRLGC